MMTGYRRLLRLYPRDIRAAYGAEMDDEFRAGLASTHGWRRARFVAREVLALVIDAFFERLGTLYSHRSFHGRCDPDLGVVRPPNMSKREWFEQRRR